MKKQKQKQKHKSKKQHKQPKLLYISVVVAVLVAVLTGFAFATNNHPADQGRLVTFHDRGQNHVILTRASTVQNALNDANISVDPQDIVEPALGSQLLSTDSAVIINRSRPVLIVDGALRQKVVTAAQSPNEIAVVAGINPIGNEDKITIKKASVIADGASKIITIERTIPIPVVVEKKPTANALTSSKGAQIFVDSNGVAHRETYYDLPMNIVINSCGIGDYTIRYDGAKIDKDGYILVAAGFGAYPRCSVVETSMGPGKVYDTGGFALRYPHGFDLATDWTNRNGR